MQFWAGGAIQTLLLLCMLLLGASLARRLVPPLRELAMPDAMVAGLLGLSLGPSGLDVIPLDTDFLEILVYHGLAIVFIAVGLQPPAPTKGHGRQSTARSMGFAIAFIAVVQGLIGLGVVTVWSFGGELLHPGLGLLLPLSFSQGPGQALSLGRAWEESGLVHGGQVGLAMAALGFLWCVFIGVPILHLGRRRGWCPPTPRTRADGDQPASPEEEAAAIASEATPAPGALDRLALHVAVMGTIYLLTWLLLSRLATLVQGNAELEKTIYGFHFIIAMFIALPARKLVTTVGARIGEPAPLNPDQLGRIAGLAVDFTTVAAFSAVRIEQITQYLAPIMVITVLGGLWTAWFCLWVAPRAFKDAPFEQVLALYGSSTGTLPTGLALLRAQDPWLRGPGASTAVVGSAFAVPLTRRRWTAQSPTCTFQRINMTTSAVNRENAPCRGVTNRP